MKTNTHHRDAEDTEVHRETQMLRRFLILITAFIALAGASFAQGDWIRTGTGLGQERVRLAASDFKTTAADPTGLLKTFNETLWSDLDNAGIFDMVSKSFYPLAQPGQPNEVRLDAWGNPPTNP